MNTVRLLAIIEAATITGPAKNLLQFAQSIRAADVGIALETYVAVFQRGGGPGLFMQAADEASVPVFPIREAGRFDRAVLGRLSDLAARLKPDIVQSHAVKSHFLARRAGLHCIAPWVAFHHGYTATDLRMRLYNQLDRWSLPAARRIVTVSAPFREQLAGIGVDSRRIDVVHNAIDPEWACSARLPKNASALRARLGIAPGKRVLLIVGRLSREKDHLTLLRALRTVRDRAPRLDPHLLVIGDGPERGRIEAAARRLRLADSTTLCGQVPSAEPYYGIADLAVLSSLSEGSPNALLEAMAGCVPAVSTAVGGVPEMVAHNRSALLVPPRDPEAMADAISAVLSDAALARRLASAARELAVRRHSPIARAHRLAQIYSSLLAA